MSSKPIDSQASQALAQKAPLSWMTGKGLVKLRPKGLASITTLLCISQLIAFGYVTPAQWNSIREVGLVLSMKIVWYWIFWFFWKGRNWARIMTVVTSCFIFLIPFFPPRHAPIMQAYMVADCVFSAYLLYWLNTKPIVRFFKAPGNGISAPQQDS